MLQSLDGGGHWKTISSVTSNAVFGSPATDLSIQPDGQGLVSVLDTGSCAMHGCEAALYTTSPDGQAWAEVPVVGLSCPPDGAIIGALSPSGRVAAYSYVSRTACPPPGGLLAVGGLQSGELRVERSFPFGWRVDQLVWAANGTLVGVGGGAVVRSTNDGKDWRQVLPAPEPLGGIDFLGPRVGFGFGLPGDPGCSAGDD